MCSARASCVAPCDGSEPVRDRSVDRPASRDRRRSPSGRRRCSADDTGAVVNQHRRSASRPESVAREGREPPRASPEQRAGRRATGGPASAEPRERRREGHALAEAPRVGTVGDVAGSRCRRGGHHGGSAGGGHRHFRQRPGGEKTHRRLKSAFVSVSRSHGRVRAPWHRHRPPCARTAISGGASVRRRLPSRQSRPVSRRAVRPDGANTRRRRPPSVRGSVRHIYSVDTQTHTTGHVRNGRSREIAGGSRPGRHPRVGGVPLPSRLPSAARRFGSPSPVAGPRSPSLRVDTPRRRRHSRRPEYAVFLPRESARGHDSPRPPLVERLPNAAPLPSPSSATDPGGSASARRVRSPGETSNSSPTTSFTGARVSSPPQSVSSTGRSTVAPVAGAAPDPVDRARLARVRAVAVRHRVSS